MSDDDDPNDFQPFALPNFGDDIPFIDDVLALPLPIQDQLIIGHPDGEHIVEPIPIPAIPLAAIPDEDWPFVVDLDDDIDVPVIEEDHIDDDLGDGEVFDIVILDVASPVVPVIGISSDSDPDSVSDSFESVTSSALLAAGVRAYPTDDDDDDAMSVAPSSHVHIPTPPYTPDHILAPVSAPVDSLPVAPSSTQIPPTTLVTPVSGCSLPPPTLDTHRIDLPTIFPSEIPAPHPWEGTSRQPPCFDPLTPIDFMSTPHFSPFETDPYLQSPRLFPPYSMSLSDPYHPSHHTGYTRDDLLLSLQLQFEILCRRVY
ncbi:hypothetical protein HanIR_Chr04g0176301 [Helianthus annuus]|nr:hypothetical protein HanIR_Chr04g0176301 [Helianthus annuus]KAJ0596808.1 hypothetical protein HanHA89_Chr04g0147151 [Helianthus annuus]